MSYPLHEFAGNRVTASDIESIQGIDIVFEGRERAGVRLKVLIFTSILDTRYLFFTLRLI
ncbi:hypothetical protein C0W66_11045 [Photobacterium kishitanii]|nr:hypothetical protein AYY23_14550 [Photobacterium kishitanii]PSW49138.1 hypothetical protein C0W66_11045 [Photobacterium kishitanii]